VELSGGLPFALQELARRGGEPVTAVDAGLLSGVPSATREVLHRVAVVGLAFDTDELVALSGRPEEEAYDHLDAALAAAVGSRPAPGTASATRWCATPSWRRCRPIGAAGSTAMPPTA